MMCSFKKTLAKNENFCNIYIHTNRKSKKGGKIMKSKLLTLVLICALVMSITGCGKIVDKMSRLSIDMDKDEVKALFGKNFVSKASKVDADGNVLDLWEYDDPKAKATYQIFFLNDKVSQWGKKEALQTFPDLHSPANDSD